MSISLNSLLTNANYFIGTKFTEGFTPLQRKVAFLAGAFFALAAVGYVIYKSCFKYPPQIEAIDTKQQNKPVETKEQNKGHQADQYDSLNQLKRPLGCGRRSTAAKSRLKGLFLPQSTLQSTMLINSVL